MVWTIEFDSSAVKELKKIDKSQQKKIISYLKDKVIPNKDPRVFGKSLKGPFTGLWRYRLGNYRIICSIDDSKFVVLVIAVAHRSKIYD